jgi:hypothetical protein
VEVDMKSFLNFLIKEEEEKKKDEPVSKEIDAEESEEETEEEETGLYGSREISPDGINIIKSLRMK